MKPKHLFFILLSALLFISLKPHVGVKNSGQAPLGRTGAPGETTCGSCHSGGSFSGSMIFQLGAEGLSEYVPGETYVITFTGDYAAPTYGFSITALDAAENPAGNFSLINENNTSLGSLSNGRQYVGHKAADDTSQWTFSWTAPANDAGAISFYYVINAANGDGGSGGDFVQTGSAVISPAESQGYTLTFFVEDLDGESIPDATISLNGEEYEAGFYVFEDLPPASYDYVVSREGYFDTSGSVTITDSDVDLTVPLEADDTHIAGTDKPCRVSIFPNPAASLLSISSLHHALEEIMIFDLQGKIVHHEQIYTYEFSLDVSALKPAVYLVQIRTSEGLTRHRIYVQR